MGRLVTDVPVSRMTDSENLAGVRVFVEPEESLREREVQAIFGKLMTCLVPLTLAWLG
jgi:hypothetical protein